MRIEKLQAERKTKAEAAAAAEKERKEKAEAEHKAKIEAETAAIKEKFDASVNQGCFRLLDWKSALRTSKAIRRMSTNGLRTWQSADNNDVRASG